MDDLSVYEGKRVLVTGHTGFKGAWLTLWLRELGADVIGYALDEPTSPGLYSVARCREGIQEVRGDVCDHEHLSQVVAKVAPEVVFHLAAQAIVSTSLDDPLSTVRSNILGTATLLEAVRRHVRDCAVVIVTSDKCYQNDGLQLSFREQDPMGGGDPYSMSKGAAELVVNSWRHTYFSDSRVALASARAGNVLGGGDWARDRIIPDCVSALIKGQPIELRNPGATRPWQHVLEPLGGYLLLGSKLLSDGRAAYCTGWNFAPRVESTCSVRELVERVIAVWGAGAIHVEAKNKVSKEADYLALSYDKAFRQLRWHPTWGLDECVKSTVEWYRQWATRRTDMRDVCIEQIHTFQRDATKGGVFTAPAGTVAAHPALPALGGVTAGARDS